jgi:hypothetical protein
LPGLLIMPAWYFTPHNSIQYGGWVGWKLNHFTKEGGLVWGEVKESISVPINGELAVTLAWAVRHTEDEDVPVSTELRVNFDYPYTGFDYEGGAARFDCDEGIFLILPPNHPEGADGGEGWRRAKEVGLVAAAGNVSEGG